ncbi:MAG: polysaccharide biosynthesis tyrosine autokinase [Pelagimonas sp.]|jgi:capsular exopolysaccharide synthesis family protein|nr:polysaccharide biosynthesis tyrosine autokinase [Pelagimonas sp.]
MNKADYTALQGNPQTPGRGLLDERDEDVLDLAGLLGSLWRGKWIISAVMALAVLAGGYYAYFVAVPTFSSTAVVMLNNREEQVVDLNSVIGGLSSDSSVVNTEVEVLKSRSLMGKVVDQLKLIEDPEFNTFLREDTFVERVKTTVKRQIGILPPEPVQAVPQVEQNRARQRTIDQLIASLRVRNVPQSLVFQVTVETTDGTKSAMIADTLVELYILNQLEVKYLATEQATGWLSERVTELQVSLEAAEAEVKAFRAETDLIGPESLAALEIQLKELRERVTDTDMTREVAEKRLQALSRANTPQAQAAASGDSQLARLLPRIDQPSIAQAFETRLVQVQQRAQLDRDRAGTQLAALIQSQAALEEQIKDQSADLITLQQLTREAEASRLLYEYFLGRLKETSVQQGVQQADSRVLSNAVVPVRPAAPRKSLILAMSAFFGALLGGLLVVLREMRNDAFRTGDDLERTTHYPVMGLMPSLPSRRRKDVIAYLSDKPTSAAAEAVRNLRTSVLLSNVDNPPQVVMTSSSLPGEGKTTVAFALAHNLVGMGKRVLLIEGDVRRRVFRQYVETPQEDGLVAVLTGAARLDDVVLQDPRIGADVLLGEKTSANAADLFSSDRFAEVLAEARQLYDMVVIDTPPVLVVPDARIIAQQVDTLLFVVKWDQTQKGQVIDSLKLFESVGRPVNGLVLNQINTNGMKRYGYGGRYGAYAAYGSKYYTN